MILEVYIDPASSVDGFLGNKVTRKVDQGWIDVNFGVGIVRRELVTEVNGKRDINVRSLAGNMSGKRIQNTLEGKGDK